MSSTSDSCLAKVKKRILQLPLLTFILGGIDVLLKLELSQKKPIFCQLSFQLFLCYIPMEHAIKTELGDCL